MTDDQGWGDVGYMGHDVLQTPVLDENGGYITPLRPFLRVTAHSRLFTDSCQLYDWADTPNRMACFSWGHSLRPEETTIAEALKTAGYGTGHFGKWHLGSCRADDDVSPGQSGFDSWVSSPNFYENSPLLSHDGKVIETEGESSAVTVQFALDFMKSQVAQEKPFLAVIWFGNPARASCWSG